MKYTLKLDIYFFSLHKILKTSHRNVRGQIQEVHRVSVKDSVFDEFFSSLNTSDSIIKPDDYMKEFIVGFVNNYNNIFRANKGNSQAVSITENEERHYNSKDYTVWGVFKGGPKGMEFEVYNEKDASEPTNMIGSDNVTSLYYFYKIWIPIDSNVGILIVQSYTNTGCTSLFKDNLQDYFISKGYKASWAKCIPSKYIEKYLKDGYINKIQVLHRRKDDSRIYDPIFSPFKKARYSTSFTNFRIPFEQLIRLPNYKSVLKSQIAAIDTNYDEESDKVKIFYKDANGKGASAKLANIESILPTITLDDSLKDSVTHVPKWDDMHKFTKLLLEDIKLQISYTPILK